MIRGPMTGRERLPTESPRHDSLLAARWHDSERRKALDAAEDPFLPLGKLKSLRGIAARHARIAAALRKECRPLMLPSLKPEA